ncbi:MAG: hypothetical protein JWO32_3043 [Bacteroidetes bacterium]|nr:hypothetical protein [Bacteroidota bacterium]
MNFDYTYIIFCGAIIFEPVTILTNFFIAAFSIFAFYKIQQYNVPLAKHWAFFFLMIGLSSAVGSLAHGAHYQLGVGFLKTTVFLMHSISLIAIYFCFKAASLYHSIIHKKTNNKFVTLFVVIWIIVLLILTFIQNNFLLIKIHAGIVLTYSLIIHIINYKKPGSANIAWGIVISFLSIVVHSLKLSLSEWFNYKDISHVFMLICLICMLQGVTKILKVNYPLPSSQ